MKQIMTLAILLLISTNVLPQDKIFLKSGENIEAIIIEVNLNDIKYKNFSNQEGPLRTINKSDIHMVLYKNGESEIFDISLKETKDLIVEYINKYAYSKNGYHKYKAIFDSIYIDLSTAPRSRPQIFLFNKLYDFTDDCTFHNLSHRNSGIGFINVYVNVMHKNRKGEYRKTNIRPKLVIRVKGHENAKILRDALIRYNDFFNE